MLGLSGDDATPPVIKRFLTDKQIQQFIEQGVLVVPNVLTRKQVAESRQGLHAELAKYGVVRVVSCLYVSCGFGMVASRVSLICHCGIMIGP